MDKFIINSAFILYIVTKGGGTLHTMRGNYDLKCGDLFITFPAKPFSIEKKDCLEYIYISFIGMRAGSILKRLKIDETSPVFSGYEYLIPFWTENITKSSVNNVDMLAESVLLYTFSNMSNTLDYVEQNIKGVTTVLEIKKFIDDNYYDTDLSLDSAAKKFSYNKKYLSGFFKKNMGVGFSVYLQTVRLQHACALMERGITSVRDIASLSGYSDQLYFSKVFKEKMGVSPKEHMKKGLPHNSQNVQRTL